MQCSRIKFVVLIRQNDCLGELVKASYSQKSDGGIVVSTTWLHIVSFNAGCPVSWWNSRRCVKLGNSRKMQENYNPQFGGNYAS